MPPAERFEADVLKNSIGVGDIKSSLGTFRANNAEGITTLSFLNCFSGIVGEQLRNEERTLVQSGSPTTQVALNLSWYDFPLKPDGKVDLMKLAEMKEPPRLLGFKNGLTEYYQQLQLSHDKTFFAAWQSAQSSFRERLSELGLDGSAYNSGRSATVQSILGWCNETDSDYEKRTGSRVGNIPSETEDYTCHSCRLKTNKRLADLPDNDMRVIYAAAQSELDEIQKKLSLGKKQATYSEAFERQVACLQYQSQEVVRSVEKHAEGRKLNDDVVTKALAIAEKFLKDPKEDALIRQNVREQAENYLNNAKETSESRKVTLRNFYKDVLDDSKWPILKTKLLANFGRIKQACQNISSEECENTKIEFEGILQFLSTEVPYDHVLACDKISEKKAWIDCRLGLRYMLGGFLSAYWTVGEPSSLVERCTLDEDITQLVLNQRQLDADRGCLEKFLRDAPKSEWKNLQRIFALSNRSVLGQSNAVRPESGPKVRQELAK